MFKKERPIVLKKSNFYQVDLIAEDQQIPVEQNTSVIYLVK